MQKHHLYIILFIICMPYISNGHTITVCTSCEVNTITQAISKATAHDTIQFLDGTYSAKNVLIEKPLTILGHGEVIFDGNQKEYIISVLADSVSILNIDFQNSGRSFTKDYAAIYLSRVKNYRIEDCRIERAFFGILVEKSHNGIIQNNTIIGTSQREDDSGNGIHLWHSSNALIRQNTISGMRDGIYFEFVSESTITENFSYDNVRYGLHFMFSNNNEYMDNTFSQNGAGVAVMFSKFITMRRNTFIKNWGTAAYGLLLKEIYDGEIAGNIFEENTIGIFVEGSNRINYELNDFNGNGWALKVAGACYGNSWHNNNFNNNAFDVSYSTKINDNEFRRNYWSSYTGYDLDKDGIGDVPYRPVKLFSYIVNQTPETIILLRSLFIDIINFSEKVSPVFTPDNLLDLQPLMNQAK